MPRLPISIAIISLLIMLGLVTSLNNAVAVRSSFDPISNVASTTIQVLPTVKESETCQPVFDVYMQDLSVRDMRGNITTQTTVGSQVQIEAKIVNDCANLDNHMLFALFEVRDSKGFSIYLTWYNSTINSKQEVKIGTSWLASNVPGEYTVRGFYLGCLNCPMVLSNVLQYKLTVLPAS